MKRDGIAFVGTMVVTALAAGQASVLMAGFGMLFGVFFGTKLLCKALLALPENKTVINKFDTDGFTFTVKNVPTELNMLQQYITLRCYRDGDKYVDTMTRFCLAIQINGVQQHLPDYLYNAIVLKMMWEVQKKYGTLDIRSDQTDLLTENEVMAPIDVAEQPNFHHFCIKHSD